MRKESVCSQNSFAHVLVSNTFATLDRYVDAGITPSTLTLALHHRLSPGEGLVLGKGYMLLRVCTYLLAFFAWDATFRPVDSS